MLHRYRVFFFFLHKCKSLRCGASEKSVASQHGEENPKICLLLVCASHALHQASHIPSPAALTLKPQILYPKVPPKKAASLANPEPALVFIPFCFYTLRFPDSLAHSTLYLKNATLILVSSCCAMGRSLGFRMVFWVLLLFVCLLVSLCCTH